MAEQQALLLLDDGTCFSGFACGKRTESMGEVIFTTGMAGYQETLTDPSYHGQIVTFTSAHVGNYGVCSHDNEAPVIQAGGAIFHELFLPESGRPGADKSAPFPHWRAEETLDSRLRRDGITGMYGVDTRALTLHLREHGARNGIISALDLDKISLLRRARALPDIRGRDLTRAVTCDASYTYMNVSENELAPLSGKPQSYAAPSGEKLRVAVYDYGVKRSILNTMLMAGILPTVWPAMTPAKTILDSKPDGVLLSNGPGDPESCTHTVREVRRLLGVVPLFGICLGHQILALALGGKTYKLPFGHHGVNHPVHDLLTGRVWITSQNHGFCVEPDSLPDYVNPSHWNLNDHTLAGLTCDKLKAFSVQFHPEAGPGPHEAAELFIRFRQLMLAEKQTITE